MKSCLKKSDGCRYTHDPYVSDLNETTAVDTGGDTSGERQQRLPSNDDDSTKRVQWRRTCSFRLVPAHNIQDKSKIWYNSKDFKSFKNEREVIVRLANDVGPEVVELTGRASMWGIEHMLKKNKVGDMNLTLERRILSHRVVLEEQEHQREILMNRQEPIAEKYREVSVPCQEEALRRGRSYAEECSSIDVEGRDEDKIASFRINTMNTSRMWSSSPNILCSDDLQQTRRRVAATTTATKKPTSLRQLSKMTCNTSSNTGSNNNGKEGSRSLLRQFKHSMLSRSQKRLFPTNSTSCAILVYGK